MKAPKGITRRSFLSSSAAVLVVGRAAACESLCITNVPGGVLITDGSSRWLIDIKALGAMSAVIPTSTSVIFPDVKLPSGFSLSLALNFELVDADWMLQGTWFDGDFGAAQNTLKKPFAQFLKGDALSVPLTRLTFAKLARATFGGQAVGAKGAALDLHPNASMVIRAESGNFKLLGSTFKVAAIRINSPPKDLPLWRGEAVGTLNTRAVSLAKSPVSAVLTLDNHARLIIQKTENPVRIQGELSLHVKSGKNEELTALIETAEIGEGSGTRFCKLTYASGYWPFKSKFGGFELSGDDVAASGDQAHKPFPANITSRNGSLTSFRMPSRLFHHNLRIDGTDRTRLDFNGPRFDFFVHGLPRDHGAAFGYELGGVAPLARINLDTAILKIARGRDLMSLAYRFKNLDLELRDGKPYLVSRKSEDAALRHYLVSSQKTRETPRETILVVDFPPQHIMERAFLRQQFELPDSEPRISPADLRTLRTANAAQAVVLRKKIRDKKLEFESKDPASAGLTPFADFSAHWDADPNKEVPPREKYWIGPTGLISVSGHQAARGILKKARVSDITELLGNLANDRAKTKDDIKTAVRLIPLPPIGIEPARRAQVAKEHAANPTEFAKAIFLEAGRDRFNSDLNDLLSAWKTTNQNDPLVMETWPLRPEEWKTLFPASPAPTLQPVQVREFLHGRLRKRLDEMNEDGVVGADCTQTCNSPEGLLLPVEARLSGGSRLAFEFEQKELALTADNLTNWQGFKLKVVRQAARLYKRNSETELESDVAAILADQGITKGPDDKGADSVRRFDEIRSAVQAPTTFETALEVPSRLILSPAQDARWRTPRTLPKRLSFWKSPDDAPHLIWQARLVEALATPSLRAVWSPDYEPNVFKDPRATNPPLGPWAPWDVKLHPGENKSWSRFRTALDSADRHELVVLSSVPGLPVVGIPPKDKNTDKKDTSQVGPPPGYGLTDIWKEIVSGSDQSETDPSAIYMPRALTTNRLILSSLGATLDLDTTFEPPSAAWRTKNKKREPLFDSFSIERWRSIIVDGRDVVTTIVRRGYLFPLGHKAALVKVTEPRVRLAISGDPKSGYIVEQAQRFFIEVSRDQQVYPATGQAHAGRGFPARQIRLLTLRTPDLLDPTEEMPSAVADTKASLKTRLRGNVQGTVSGGPGQPDKPLAGLVFWPRTDPGPAGTVRFRMSIDNGASAVSLPLLFVDNRAVNDAATIEALCRRYYSDSSDPNDPTADAKPVAHNLVSHNGAPRRYADEQQPGQCTFNTDWQLIAAEGRPLGYDFDGSLQAATQPPFYPRLVQAQVRSQQIQSLTGSGAPPVLVTYNENYVRTGFGTSAKEQTFLDAVPFDFNMGSNGDRSGGVGRMALRVVGFNRRLGPIGNSPSNGRSKQTEIRLPSRTRYAAATINVSDGLPPASSSGSLDKFIDEFFPSGARLLGLIEFRDFVKLALALLGGDNEKLLPILQEVAQFAIPQEQIATIFDDDTGSLTKLLKLLNDRISDIGRAVFADLATGLDDLGVARKHVSDLNRAKPPPEDLIGELALELTKAWSAGQRVLHALDEISRTPLAPVTEAIRQSIGKFKDSFSPDALRDLDPGRLVRIAVAERLSAATKDDGPWANAVVFVAAGPGKTALDRLKVNATAWQEVWASPDPINAIGRAILKDPAVSTLSEDVRDEMVKALPGPLYAEMRNVVGALNDIANAGLAEGAQKLTEAMQALIAATKRFEFLANKASDVCKVGAVALRDLIQAVMPDLGMCPAPTTPAISEAVGTATCRALQTAAADFSRLTAKIGAAAATSGKKAQLQAFVGFAEAFNGSIGRNLQNFQQAVTAISNTRSSILLQIGPSTNCADFPAKAVSSLSDLWSGRDRVAMICLNALKVGIPLPDGLPPAEIKDDWAGLATAFVKISAAFIDFAKEITTAGAAHSGSQKDSLENVRLNLLSVFNRISDEPDATPIFGDIDKILSDARNLQTQIETFKRGSVSSFQDAVLSADRLAKQADDILKKAALNERELLRRTLREALASLVPDNLKKLLDTVLRKGAAAVSELYRRLLDVRDSALSEAHKVDFVATQFFGDPPCPAGWAESILLVPTSPGICASTVDQFTLENKQAHDASEAIDKKTALDESDAASLQALLARWQHNQSAPQKIVMQVDEFLAHGARAKLQRLLDVDSIRHDLEDQIRNLTPFRKTLTSNLNLPLHETTVLDFVKFTPSLKPGTSGTPTLVLESIVTTQLDQAKVTSTFKGTVPPFKLTIPEILSVTFALGINYSGGSGQTGKLEAPLKTEDVEFGKTLSFLAELSKSLSLGGDDGPFTHLSLVNPAIEAGYRIAIPVITLGATFTNINFFGSILLPLEEKAARVRFALGSIDSPFMISAGIYGGTGYFGLEGSANGIEAFDSAFEFGGIASIGYGPLQGTAYVTSGVYVRQAGTRCTLSGIFSAGFTAHIACFSISAAFTLRLTPQEGGSLLGQATLTFSFAVGFARVSYNVQAERKVGPNFGGAGNSATAWLEHSPTIQLADANNGSLPSVSWCRLDFGDAPHAELVVIGLSAGDHWGFHSQYFDRTLRPSAMDLT